MIQITMNEVDRLSIIAGKSFCHLTVRDTEMQDITFLFPSTQHFIEFREAMDRLDPKPPNPICRIVVAKPKQRRPSHD